MEEENKTEEKLIKDAEEIRQRIITNRRSMDIHITRVPLPTYESFREWAKEEFCFDYGMALKHLWDFYNGLIPTGWEHLEVELEAQKKEIELLKAEVFKPKEEKIRKRLDGGIIK